MEFSRQESWNWLPFHSQGYLPDPGTEPMSLMPPHWQAGSLPIVPPGKPVISHLAKNNWQISYHLQLQLPHPEVSLCSVLLHPKANWEVFPLHLSQVVAMGQKSQKTWNSSVITSSSRLWSMKGNRQQPFDHTGKQSGVGCGGVWGVVVWLILTGLE